MKEEPCSIDSGGMALRGMLHAPDAPPRGALLFCAPLFEERKSAHRPLVETARALCARGWAVLRFDYRGCGDSDGVFADFSGPDWLADIRSAAAFLHASFPGVPLGILGLRLGGSLALQAAAAGGSPVFQRAILWEPAVAGRDYLDQELRKKLMKEMVTFGKSLATRETLMQELATGRTIDFDGHPITPRLHRDLGALDLLTLRGPFPSQCLTVAIGGADRPSPPLQRLDAALRAGGAAAELVAVREPPFWNLVGLVSCPELIRVTADWLERAT